MLYRAGTGAKHAVVRWEFSYAADRRKPGPAATGHRRAGRHDRPRGEHLVSLHHAESPRRRGPPGGAGPRTGDARTAAFRRRRPSGVVELLGTSGIAGPASGLSL